MDAKPLSRFLVHGIAGGVVAGLVVAGWFFVVDLIRTEPFDTPALLASTFLGEEYRWPTGRLVAIYTLLHFGVFATLGLATAWFLRATNLEPGLLVGAVFGLGVLNGVYYGSRLVAGVNVLGVLPVGHVLGANLAGGMGMMIYLHRMLRARAPLGPGTLSRYPLLLEGLGTGLIGAGAVAFWFLLVDIMIGIPFETPAALGSAVLLGATSPDEVQLTLAVIGAYTVVHVAAFWAVGTAFTWVVHRLEDTPGLWLMVLMGFIVLEALFVGAAILVGSWVLGALSWWAVGVGNLIAVGSMGWYLWRTHPQLERQLSAGMAETQV